MGGGGPNDHTRVNLLPSVNNLVVRGLILQFYDKLKSVKKLTYRENRLRGKVMLANSEVFSRLKSHLAEVVMLFVSNGQRQYLAHALSRWPQTR